MRLPAMGSEMECRQYSCCSEIGQYVMPEDGRHLLLTDTINHILFFSGHKNGWWGFEDITGMPMPLAIYVVKT